jgi:hypothetical protein
VRTGGRREFRGEAVLVEWTADRVRGGKEERIGWQYEFRLRVQVPQT